MATRKTRRYGRGPANELRDRFRDRRVDKRTDLLRRIRNSISHGARPVGADAQKLLSDEDQLAEFLKAVADGLS